MNGINIKGQVELKCFNADGSLKWETGFMENTITTAGLAVIAGLAGGVDSQTEFTYLAVGTDATASASSQTALIAELTDSGLARASATVTRETTTETDDTLQLVHQWSVTGTKTVEEVGIFNDATTGTMLGRKLTTSKSVVNGETLQGTYQIIFS